MEVRMEYIVLFFSLRRVSQQACELGCGPRVFEDMQQKFLNAVHRNEHFHDRLASCQSRLCSWMIGV
jgi:hypothetical protein